MGRQHPGMDGLDTGRRHEESGETRGVEGAGCQVICDQFCSVLHFIDTCCYISHITISMWVTMHYFIYRTKNPEYTIRRKNLGKTSCSYKREKRQETTMHTIQLV